MAVTIKDIAKAANVSPTTVSRVVNNRLTGISDAKRDEIQKLIVEMGYYPNSMARGLVTKKTNALGLILPNIVDPFFAEIARSVQDTAELLGYFVILINSDDDRDKERNALLLLKEKCVDGIMLYASGKLSLREWEALQSLCHNTPLVLMGHTVPESGAPTVFVDYRKGMLKMTHYLVEKGHQKIVYMAGMSVLPDANEGLCGYMEALIKNDIQLKQHLVCCGDFTFEGAKGVLKKLLDSSFEFSAVICENDLMAAGVLELLEENNINVPSRVSVVGFDNTFVGRLSHPKLTTLDYPKHRMGKETVHLILQIIQTSTSKNTEVELDAEILERLSVASS